MKVLQKVLAIIAFLVLAPQTVRHAYMIWLEPRGSVLDKYDQPMKGQIAAADSLDELSRRYEPLRRQTDLAKQESSKSGKPYPGLDHPEEEPYRSEQMLRDAITQWEQKSKEIHELRFYWLVGLVICVLGLVTYSKFNRWFGLTLLITGFSEFIYWTSPSFLGGTREFDRLLGHKLVLSLVSLALLIAAIQQLGIFSESQHPSGNSNP